jgi:hypothetical protein
MDIATIANNFEDLIVSDRIRFRPVIPGELDEFTYYVVSAFLVTNKLNFLIGDKKIERATCFKIEDPYLQFLDVYPEQMKFMWCTNMHREGVMPDDALKYLIERAFPGMKIEISPDGSVQINKNITMKMSTSNRN